MNNNIPSNYSLKTQISKQMLSSWIGSLTTDFEIREEPLPLDYSDFNHHIDILFKDLSLFGDDPWAKLGFKYILQPASPPVNLRNLFQHNVSEQWCRGLVEYAFRRMWPDEPLDDPSVLDRVELITMNPDEWRRLHPLTATEAK